MLGIIGGSGLTQLSNLDVSHREVVRTRMASLPVRSPSASSAANRQCSWHVTATATRFRRTRSITGPTSGRCGTRGDRIISVASVGGIRADLSPRYGHSGTSRSSTTPGASLDLFRRRRLRSPYRFHRTL